MRPTAFTLTLVILAVLALGARFIHTSASATPTATPTIATTAQ
ncbi:MAG TPA: hypothetical protein VHQ47_00615 [Phycisphaerae bacterium]|nr:hypothetical protein [Phycisphaerae bacterium]